MLVAAQKPRLQTREVVQVKDLFQAVTNNRSRAVRSTPYGAGCSMLRGRLLGLRGDTVYMDASRLASASFGMLLG
jgi:hypothetical protein